MLTRNVAWDYLQSMISNPGLLNHCLAVEKVMLGFSQRYGLPAAEQLQWAIAGLLHDADWEKYPDNHPAVVVQWVTDQSELEIAHAIAAHGVSWNVPHNTLMSKVLVASDELTGFIEAYRRVRPDGLRGMTGTSVIKKLKNLTFAAGVDRREVYAGAAILGTSVETHANAIIEILSETEISHSSREKKSGS
jgi:predicted hydrolase (HD superfamily)